MRLINSLLLIFLFSAHAFAGGTISGKITDEASGETVIGATVLIKGTANGTVTDVDGQFSLKADPGTYVLSIKYLGYTNKEVDGIVVTEGKTTGVNIAISESSSTQLDEFVVRSSLKKENISALYSIQKNSATISDGISSDIIKKSPDRNTGEVLKRVSGTTIQDGRFVIVRGLSDRYNIALIDNAILPSTEPNRRAFSFDITPAAMIDNIIITKAATPDLPGDFSGGVINILTKETPEQNFNSLSLGLSYNTASTGKTFKSGYRSSTDILGFDDGARQLPANFPTTETLGKGVTTAKSIEYLSLLNNDFKVREHTALPGINFQGTLGRIYRLKNANKFGFTGALTYTHNETRKENLIRKYDNYDYTDNVYTYSSNLGGLLNAGYYFGGNKIVFKSLYNRIFDDNFLYRTGINYSSTTENQYYAFDLVQKSLLKTSLEGEHQVGKGQSKLGWLLAFNNVTNNQPDQRKVSYSRTLGSNSDFAADNTTLGKANNRLFGNLNENIYNGAVNFTTPFSVGQTRNNFKIGVFALYRDRAFSNRYLGAVLDPLSSGNPDAIRKRPIETLYAADAINNGAYYINDLTLPADKYNATATTSAAYAMMDNKLTDKFRIVWGARFESYALNLQSGKVNINPVWNDLLPSANITYSLTKLSNLRASYFKSIARPELREIAPLSYYDYELNATLNGNPDLQRSQIDNVDLRYEIYPAAGEIISASIFYKHFNKTIENQVYGQLSSYDITTVNYAQASNIGVEFEVRKNLEFIAPSSFLKNLSYYLNVAFIKSTVQLVTPDEINGKYFSQRPLSGQSPYVINTSLTYATSDGKLNFNLLYNRIGPRLFLVGQSLKGNVYEVPRNLLDFQVSYSISERSDLKFNAKDILNNNVRFYFDQNNNGKFDGTSFTNGHIDPQNDWIYQQYKPGSQFSLTYSYKF